MKFISFLNKPKNLDLSYKTDLDLWDCLGRVKHLLNIAKLYSTDLVICSYSRGEGNPIFLNTVH